MVMFVAGLQDFKKLNQGWRPVSWSEFWEMKHGDKRPKNFQSVMTLFDQWNEWNRTAWSSTSGQGRMKPNGA